MSMNKNIVKPYFDDLSFSKHKTEWLRGGIKNEGGKTFLIVELSTKVKQFGRKVDDSTFISFTIIKRSRENSVTPPQKTQDFFTHFAMINHDEIWPVNRPIKSGCLTLANPASPDRIFAKMSLTLSEKQLRECACYTKFDGKNVQCLKAELIVSRDKRIGVFKIDTMESEINDFINGVTNSGITQTRSIF